MGKQSYSGRLGYEAALGQGQVSDAGVREKGWEGSVLVESEAELVVWERCQTRNLGLQCDLALTAASSTSSCRSPCR